jgi:hypothetical protein
MVCKGTFHARIVTTGKLEIYQQARHQNYWYVIVRDYVSKSCKPSSIKLAIYGHAHAMNATSRLLCYITKCILV